MMTLNVNLHDGFAASEADQILTEPEAARWLRVSVRTLQRMRLAGDGPVFIQLGERRLGYQVASLRRWIGERGRASTSAPLPAKAVRR